MFPVQRRCFEERSRSRGRFGIWSHSRQIMSDFLFNQEELRNFSNTLVQYAAEKVHRSQKTRKRQFDQGHWKWHGKCDLSNPQQEYYVRHCISSFWINCGWTSSFGRSISMWSIVCYLLHVNIGCRCQFTSKTCHHSITLRWSRLYYA